MSCEQQRSYHALIVGCAKYPVAWTVEPMTPPILRTLQRKSLKEKLKGEGVLRVVTPRFGEVFELD
jgi:hypothetical protein